MKLSCDIQIVRASLNLKDISKVFLLLILSIFLHQQVSSSPVSQPVSFSFPSFNPTSCSYGNLICTGAVNAYDGYLSLTSEPFPSNSTSSPSVPHHKVGRVLYPWPVLAWPAMISNTFTIRISQYPNSGAGDGMTFIFAPDTNPSPLDSDGSFLGIMSRSPHGGSVSQLALELDTFTNEFDPDANHIGIDATNMSKPITVTSLNGTGIDLKSGRNIKVQIDYDGRTKMLYVSMAYSEYPLGRILEKPIIMSDVVPSSVYVGFTAATGDFSESHQVLDWTFTTMPLPSDSLKSRKLIKP
ncbi:hypothetical protein AB3S75_016376 [Citrus x aurantiifolia]